MAVTLVEEGLKITAQDVTIIISDEEFDPVFWLMLVLAVRDGEIYG